MNEIRRSSERGFADHGWLKSFHTFSFADYFDPEHVEFGPLRVINEDRVQAGAASATHSHRDMEIISYVLDGELAHKDSMGNGSTIKPGDVQRMSAGTGVRHSEFNPSPSESVHFLQIWIQPAKRNIEPSYEEKRFAPVEKRGRLRLIVSPDRADGSLLIHQERGCMRVCSPAMSERSQGGAGTAHLRARRTGCAHGQRHGTRGRRRLADHRWCAARLEQGPRRRSTGVRSAG